MRSPIMKRRSSKYFLFIVPLFFVVLKTPYKLHTIFSVKPYLWEYLARFLYSIIYPYFVFYKFHLVRSILFLKLFKNRDARYKKAMRFLVSVMRQVYKSKFPIFSRYIIVYIRKIMIKRFPTVFVVIHEIVE